MVHVGALPGTPKNSQPISEIIQKALYDAHILESEGVNAIMIENMHDRPYMNRIVGPEIVASLTAIAVELKNKCKLPLGIQILAGANKQALAVALAAQLSFIRAEGFVFGHLADEGMMNSDAGELLRYRKQIGADHIRILTDIKKKHSSHAISSDLSVAETAEAAAFFLSDGIIVTGATTGQPASPEDIKVVKKSVSVPVIIGSGIDQYNISEFWDLADAFIVGSSLKKEGKWENEVDQVRVKQFMEKTNRLKRT